MYPCRSIDNTGINCRGGGGGGGGSYLSSWVTDADFKQSRIFDFEGGCLDSYERRIAQGFLVVFGSCYKNPWINHTFPAMLPFFVYFSMKQYSFDGRGQACFSLLHHTG